MPLVLVVAILIFEVGRSVGSIVAQRLALVLAGVIPLFGLWYGANTLFAMEVTAQLGNPFCLAWFALFVFYLVAWLRGEKWGEAGTVVASIALTMTRMDRLGSFESTPQSLVPLAVLTVVLLIPGLKKRCVKRLAISWTTASICIIWHNLDALSEQWRVLVLIHAILLGNVAIAAWLRRDQLARFLRQASLWALSIAAIIASADVYLDNLLTNIAIPYVVGVVVIGLMHFGLRQQRWYVAAISISIISLMHIVWHRAFFAAREATGGGSLLAIELGLLFFLLGVGVSVAKTGFGKRLMRRVGQW